MHAIQEAGIKNLATHSEELKLLSKIKRKKSNSMIIGICFSGALTKDLYQLFSQLFFLKPWFRETHRGGRRTHILSPSRNTNLKETLIKLK